VETSGNKFAELYEKNHRVIYRFIYRLISDENTASDIMQDTFINFMKIHKDRELPEYEQCRMYLFRTARNLLINHQKSYYHRNVNLQSFSETEGNPGIATSATAEDDFIRQETRSDLGENLTQALHGLNEKERSVILLRYNEEFSLEKIAGIMDISIATAHRLIKKAEKNLLDFMKKKSGKFSDLDDLTGK